MKVGIAVAFILGIMFSTFAQDKNDLLYDAIVKSDEAAVGKLLADGANANYVKELKPWLRVNMLIAAIDNSEVEIVKLLLANKASVNFRDGFNTTALMYAASAGNIDIVKLLVGAGANVNDNDGKGNSVLSAAKESQEADVIAYIEAKIKAGQ